MALTDGHYRTAALALETARACHSLDNVPVMRLAMINLCNLYSHVRRDTTEHIALWLFQHYGSRMYDRHVPVGFIGFIAALLNVPVPDDSLPQTPRDTGNFPTTFADRKDVRSSLHFSTRGGHSISLGLCPTKLPVIWDIWPDQPDVPVIQHGKRLSQEPPV